MRLLIITQSVDLDNPILAFFHRWIVEFAKNFEEVNVICLEEGRHNLPSNVKILSLGKKAKPQSFLGRVFFVKIKYIFNFYKYIVLKSKSYDTVFVHMNPIYVVLGGWFWKMTGKKINLWYTHRNVDIKLKIAEKFADRIFTASKESFVLPSDKVKIMGHGIDIQKFSAINKEQEKHKLRIISVGRITPIKNCHILIEAAKILRQDWSREFEIIFIGQTVTNEDLNYEKRLKEFVKEHHLEEIVKFNGFVGQEFMPQQYALAHLSVNLTPTGGVDKAVLESMAAKVPVLSSNHTFKDYFGDLSERLIFAGDDASDLAAKIRAVLEAPDLAKIVDKLAVIVAQKADVVTLIKRLSTEVSPRYAVSGGRFAEGSTEVTPRYRIVFFGADYPPTGGGISTYAYEWIARSAENNRVDRVEAIIFGNKDPRLEKNPKSSVRTVGSRNFLIISFMTLFCILKHGKKTIFHSLNLFPVGFFVVLWCKILGFKSAVTFYGTDACTSEGSNLTRKLKRWTIEKAFRAFTISNFTAKETASILNIKRKIEVVGALVPEKILALNGDNNNFLEDKKTIRAKLFGNLIDEDDFVILSVSRIVERKGLDLLIKAIASIDKPKIKVVLVGDGKEKARLEKMVASLALSKRVIFAGKVADLKAYYKSANVAVLLSYYIRQEGDFEGLGLVLLEAQYYGLPVIGTNSGGISEAFENDRTGILVPEKNTEAIALAILDLAENKNKRLAMSSETAHFLAQKFGSSKVIGHYLDLL